ncbi:MAG: DNA/RNA helicase domain-containing protein [Thermoplasmata archaeon]
MTNFAWFSTTGEFLKELENPEFISSLKGKFRASFKEDPSIELVNSWASEIVFLKKALEGVDGSIVLEYRIPGSGERADVIVISEGKERNAVIIEMKGWRKGIERSPFLYETDQNPPNQVNPIYQMLNYVGKIRFTSSSGDSFKVDGKVVLYNMDRNDQKEILVFRSEEKRLESYLKSLITRSGSNGNGIKFVQSTYRQNKALFEVIKDHYRELSEGAMETLAETGFGLYLDQLSVYNKLVKAIEHDEGGQFIIQGGPGSGKTMIAVELLLRSLSMKKQSVLCYRNNRMIESLRKLFASIESGLDGVIKFFSTGRPNNPGVAEKGWRSKLDVAIFDEAQRMTLENIKLAGEAARTTIFFYDEKQILSTEEQGTSENFSRIYPQATIMKLSGLYRNGLEYGKFVENLLNSQFDNSSLTDYELYAFDDITRMIQDLKSRQKNGKTALVASFTESKGNINDKQSIENIRIGYPLSSNLDLYRDKDITIKWLMDPKKDYAPFWVDGQSNNMDRCASVYGSQGFEADYVGLIWGRDLVMRKGRFELGDNCEDSPGGRNSLKRIFMKGKLGDKEAYDKARSLLINRYRILMTRGIRGTFIFCEDPETASFLQQTIQSAKNIQSIF